ncbi:hypothetical protein UlMin_032459 [Ulmus minor]
MGVLGCLQFAVNFFLDFLAWPLLALGYPLCASIKAIETNSVSDAQKLNTYWVVFSLILLFEHASVKLLQWFSFWPYIRVLIVCLLVIPYFDGASYVYKHLLCYCLSLDPQIVINWFHKWMESSFKRQKLLAEVERFVKENGTEALEKLIASKSDGTNNVEVEEIKAVSSIENKLVNKVSQVEPNLVWTENQIVASGGSKKTVPKIAVGRQELLQISVSKPVQKERMYENLIIATGETEESLPEIAVGREELPQTSASKPVQKEWTCNICNITTQSELVFNSHLQGKKHNNKVVREAMKAKNETVLSEKTEVKEAMKAKNETVLSEKTEVQEAMKAKNEEVKEAMKATNKTVLSEKTEVEEAMKAKNKTVLSEKTEVKEAMKAKNETVLSIKTEVKEAMKAKNETVLSEKIDVKEAMKAKNIGTVLSEKTEVNKSKAIPCYENKGVTQSNLNEPDVERKHLKPVVVLEKNEVTTVSQVSQAEPNIVQTKKQIIATVETKETITDVAPRKELPQTSTSKPVQREWTCSICNVTVLCETVFNSHLQGKKHKKAVLNEEMKAKNQTVVPSYTLKKSDSPNQEPVSSSKNQTVLPKVVPSYIPKKSDLPDEEPGNSTKNHTVLPKVVYVPKKSDSPNEKPGNSLKNQTVLPEVASSYTPKKSDQPSVEHANTSKDQTVQPKVGLSYIQKKSDWITIIEASGWDVPCETWQSKPKNISASTAAKKPGECKEEKVQGQQQKNQKKETVAQNDFTLYCSLCNVSYTSKLDMASHLRSRRHLIQVQTSSGV